MKLRVTRDDLLSCVEQAARCTGGKGNKPVLASCLLRAAPGSLIVAATDLEIALVTLTQAVEVAESGAVVVPADRLLALVRNADDGDIELESDGDSLRLRTNGSKYRLLGFDAREFPPLPMAPESWTLHIAADRLLSLTERTRFACAKELTRYAINGLYINVGEAGITAVGTDGKRLSIAELGSDAFSGDRRDGSAVLPLKAVAVVERLLAGAGSDPVAVSLESNAATFSIGPTLVRTMLVEGTYPQYREVLPKDPGFAVEFGTEALAAGVRRAGLLVAEESKRMVVELAGKDAVLTGGAAEVGESRIRVGCDYEGEPFAVALNPEYVSEGIAACCDGETARLRFVDHEKPVVLEHGLGVYVVMPLTLKMRDG